MKCGAVLAWGLGDQRLQLVLVLQPSREEQDREEEEDEEDSEEEEAYKARTKKTKLLPNWRKITNDQRELLSNAGHDETSTNAMTHADVSRRISLT